VKGQQKYGQNGVQTYDSTQPNLGTSGVAYRWWGPESLTQLVPS